MQVNSANVCGMVRFLLNLVRRKNWNEIPVDHRLEQNKDGIFLFTELKGELIPFIQYNSTLPIFFSTYYARSMCLLRFYESQVYKRIHNFMDLSVTVLYPCITASIFQHWPGEVGLMNVERFLLDWINQYVAARITWQIFKNRPPSTPRDSTQGFEYIYT